MKKILYIDDNKHNLALMESVVKSLDSRWEIQCVSHYKKFLEISLEKIDLFIIDFTLDDILGDALFEKLLQIQETPEVIIISAGSIEDLSGRFEKFQIKPSAITDRFGVIEILKCEIERQNNEL